MNKDPLKITPLKQKFTIKNLVFTPWVHQSEMQGKLHAKTIAGDYFVWLHKGQWWRWSHPQSGPHCYEKAESIEAAINYCNAYNRELLKQNLEEVHTCSECSRYTEDEWDGGWCYEEAVITHPSNEACAKFKKKENEK